MLQVRNSTPVGYRATKGSDGGNLRPLRVLQVVAPALVGGLERVVAALALGLRGRGHDTHVLAVLDEHTSEHPFLGLLDGTGLGVSPLILKPRRYFRERSAVRHLCETFQPDIVHTHGYRPDVVDAPVARRMRIPTVTTFHGFTAGDWKNRLYERLQVASARKSQAVIAVSQPLIDLLESFGVDPRRLHLVRNAWRGGVRHHTRAAARRNMGVSLDGFRVGWVGRLSREKGPDLMLRCLPHVTDLPVSVSFLGDAPDRRRLEVLASALGVSDRVIWHGTVNDAPALMRAFDVFVLSSRTEGTPISLLEAIDAGVPVIATRVGGVPDVVTPVEALLIDPDDPAGLARAIRHVYEDPRAAAERALAARQRMEEGFGMEPWLRHHETIYRRLGVDRPRVG